MSSPQQIKQDYGILDAIPMFNTEAHDQLEINMHASGDAANKLREMLKDGVISHHDTRHGPYVILAHWSSTHGLSYELFSYHENGGQKQATFFCNAFRHKLQAKRFQ